MKIRVAKWLGLGAAAGVFSLLYREGYVHDFCQWVGSQVGTEPHR